ncbi:MAG: sigma-70 family RNA polymerase sigma factor [bacterium]|jgi:RNA polymerase sigma-70 factor (ECF subfamily)
MDQRTRQAFTLWTQAQPAVSAFVHALVGDRAARDEVLQEVALAILESFDRYDASRPFLPWALAIARNEVANAHHRGRRFPALLSEAAESALADAVASVSDDERARLAHLADCLARLEGRPREICDLRYRTGLSPARIAGALGMQPNTVSKALERVRTELRECIERRIAAEGTR